MRDLIGDHDAIISLIIDEYRELQKHDKNHRLLRYLSKVEDFGFDYSKDKKTHQEFLKRYTSKENVTDVIVILARYYVDLKKAVDKIEEIDRSPKIESLKPQEPLTLEKIIEK